MTFRLQPRLCWIFLFSTCFHLVLTQNGCDVVYIEQPQVQHSCNPYEGGLRLRCTVYGTERLLDHTINWYRVLVTNESISEPEHMNEERNAAVLFQNRQLLNSNFVNSEVVESDAGYYWCQVALKDQNNTLNSSYVPSQRFTLLPPSVYQGYPPCSRRGRLSRQSSMCAEDGVMLTPLFEWPSSTNSTDNPAGSVTSVNPSESSVDTMEGIDPIVLIVVTSILSIFIAALFFFILVVACKLICRTKRKSETLANEVEVGSFTPAEVERAVTESATSTRYRQHTDVYLPENSYLSLEQSVNAGYVEIENGILQYNTQSNATNDTSSVPAHVLSLNSACAVTSNIALTSSSISSEDQEEPSSLPSSDNGCVTMRDGHEYHIIDPKKKEKAEQVYTNRRKPPPLLPKKHTLKHLGAISHNTASKGGTSQSAKSLSLLVSAPMETKGCSPTHRGDSSRADSKTNDSRSRTVSTDIPQSVTCVQLQVNESKPQQYQSLIPSTKDYTSVYSSPQAIPPTSQFHNDMEYHYI